MLVQAVIATPKEAQYKVVAVSNLRKRNKLLDKLINLGWTTWEDEGEIYFAKHFYQEESKKRRVFYQLLSSPFAGTGLYIINRSQDAFDIQEVNHRNEPVLKLYCYDFDAYGGDIRATEEEMGKERFLSFLIKNRYIKPEEKKYFTAIGQERRKLAESLPRILLHTW